MRQPDYRSSDTLFYLLERNVMQVTVDDLSTVKKVLHIEIPENDIARELDQAYKELKKTSKIKGFRPGKTPRSVLERMFKKMYMLILPPN
ncbi:MAG: trigger factor family protein [Deltaproteobacteria bacterium]|nr:trigger factor family protein [Deltaproteobacteria bacterium]